MQTKVSKADRHKAVETIERGRRSKWWRRNGGRSRGFNYIDADGKSVTNPDDLERIASLVIPPAWEHVRICPSPKGRLQAVGVDTCGRIQYKYHPSFTKRQQKLKFAKIESFGKFLPKFYEVTNRDLSTEGLSKEKVLAVIMRLINSLYFRVGTDRSARHYKTFGITTLNKKHLTIGKRGKLRFDFIGKSHVVHRLVLVDEELSAVVKEIATLGGGRKLFRYISEDGKARAVTPTQLNFYLKAATDPRFSAKDFRTWGGTLLAAVELAEIGTGDTEADSKKNLVRAIKKVAERLGNTPAVCRASYIHPSVIDAYLKGKTIEHYRPKTARSIKRIHPGLDPEESALIRLLENP